VCVKCHSETPLYINTAINRAYGSRGRKVHDVLAPLFLGLCWKHHGGEGIVGQSCSSHGDGEQRRGRWRLVIRYTLQSRALSDLLLPTRSRLLIVHSAMKSSVSSLKIQSPLSSTTAEDPPSIHEYLGIVHIQTMTGGYQIYQPLC
jgi:hypothetical protein